MTATEQESWAWEHLYTSNAALTHNELVLNAFSGSHHSVSTAREDEALVWVHMGITEHKEDCPALGTVDPAG